MNCYEVTLSHPSESNITSRFNFAVKAFNEEEAISKIKRAILPEKKDRIFCKYSKKCVSNCNNCIM
jgi:hypothetical protein